MPQCTTDAGNASGYTASGPDNGAERRDPWMNNDKPAGPELQLTLDDATRSLRASLVPDAQVPRIDPFWVRDRLADAGFSAMKVRTDGIKSLLAHYNAGKAVSELEIADCVDAALQVVVSPSALEARLTIAPPQGGHAATKAEVLEQLSLKGIHEGVLVDEINRAIADGKAHELIIARGREAVTGDDGVLECLLPDIRARVPNVRACGRTDYRDLGEIQVVGAGDALMRRHPPTPGTAGVDVLGKPIAPKAGKDIRFASKLSGVRSADDDPDLLVAAIDGQPLQVRGGMMVEPVFTVDTVNMATGNIRYDGAVRVRGDVKAGMSIHASGDIEIGGVVEPATLESGGSIVVKSGVLGGIGQKDSNSHCIRCTGSFSAIYAQQARIEAGDSIFIDDLAMKCELTAANHIRLGLNRRGQVIGGLLRATLSIHARTLGAPNRIRTELEIGTDPALAGALQASTQARDSKESELLEMGKLLSFSDRYPDRIAPAVRLRAEQTAAALSADIEALRGEEVQLRQRLSLAQHARVNAERAIHDGVVVRMAESSLRIHGERGPTTVRLADHNLAVFALEDDGHLDDER